jgi:GTP-binding protein
MYKGIFTVALVGRPNVGKSTLFNRIAGKRRAITYDRPGVTRDLVEEPVEYDGKRFRLIDTGGYSIGGEEEELLPKVRAQVLKAIFESDLVVFLVDVRDGILPLDREIAAMLRERGKTFLLAANKVEGPKAAQGAAEFHALGVDGMILLSAEHGTGVDDLLEAVVERIPEGGEGEAPEEGPHYARIAVVGRPNVGKSTLVNTLAGFERVIASEIPGTTRDSVDVRIDFGGEHYLFIDTAGIRAKRKTDTVLEKFSVIKSLDSIRRCDLAVLLVDATGGLTHQDQQILRYILDEERAVVVAVNKSDLPADEELSGRILPAIRKGLGYASFASVLPISASEGKGIARLFKAIREGCESYRQRIPTGVLNREAHGSLFAMPIPSTKGRNRALYITQTGTMPPSFTVFVKDREGIPDSFTRFLVNRIRERFGFAGSPLRVVYRER